MAAAAIFVPDGRRGRSRGQALMRRFFIHCWAGAAMAGMAIVGMVFIESDGVAILAGFRRWRRWWGTLTGCECDGEKKE